MFQAIALVSIAFLVGIDQLTKWLTVTFLKGNDPITIIGGFFELTYVENRGAAFGMLQGERWFFIVFTALVMLALLGLLLFGNYRKHRLFNTSLILIVAGGIGNLIDRVANGFVVDFLHVFLKTDSIQGDFPVFNVADCCVVIGSVLLLLFFFFFYEEKPSKKTEVTTNDDHTTNG